MSFEHWLNYLNSAEKKSTISGCYRRVIYKFPDGQQMIEDYNMQTGVAERRAWRRCRQLMKEPEWEIELGETPRQINQDAEVAPNQPEDFCLLESNDSPVLSKRLTKQHIEWRVRNLPYPLSVYSVKALADRRRIIISTSNKKYYKALTVPELDRCNLVPEQSRISVHHQYNTLIITYLKPDIVHEMEAQVLLMLKNVPTDKAISDMMKQLLAQ